MLEGWFYAVPFGLWIGAQPRLKSLGGLRFGSQNRGACAPRPATGRAGDGCEMGSSLPLWRSGGITLENVLKTRMLNHAFWWLLRSLVGCLGRIYPSKQACHWLNQFQIFNFSAVVALMVVRIKKANQMEITKQYSLWNFLLFWKLRPRSWGDTLLVPQHKRLGNSLPRSLRLLRLWLWRNVKNWS